MTALSFRCKSLRHPRKVGWPRRQIYSKVKGATSYHELGYIVERRKRLACVINSSERSGFLRFYVYLCLMSDILYLGFSSTEISEFSDMGKY